MKLSSIIFHTKNLSEIRAFYEEKLNLPTGTYVQENKTVPDYSDSYVNYYLDGGLLCFEEDTNRTDIGTIVLHIDDFKNFRNHIEKLGINILRGNDDYFKIKDPEGREIIIEPLR